MTANESRALQPLVLSPIRGLASCLTIMVMLTQPAAAGLVYQMVYETQPLGFGAPNGALVLAGDGNFYGTTSSALGGFGTIFRVTPGGALTVLFAFNGTNGINPNTLIEGKDGNLYGTTQFGGVGYMAGWSLSGNGTIFRITLGGVLTTLFSFGRTNGSCPSSLLEGIEGDFYGTTSFGGTGYDADIDPQTGNGTVFRLVLDGTLTMLGTFSGTNGLHPNSLAQGGNGDIYGTTIEGGTNLPEVGGQGTVFEIPQNGVVTTLVSFDGRNGCNPSYIMKGSDGNFYGTTTGGGAYYGGGLCGGAGSVFRLTPSGELVTLASFNGLSGAFPNRLAEGTQGEFYGTTAPEFPNDQGTVFVMSNGIITTLFSFDGTKGGSPQAVLPGTNGCLYGITEFGGVGGYGTFFSITSPSNFNSLAVFPKESAANPYCRLTQAADGNFYGTSYAGGSSDLGTVFKLTSHGSFSILHSFSGTDGSYPIAGLIQASNGVLYGTTSGLVLSNSGTMLDNGTVFSITTNASFATLHKFNGGDGSNPIAPVIEGKDGAFYGTTPIGGRNRLGTVYKIAASGVFNTLHSFNGSDGLSPIAALVQNSDGSFYGTTAGGGSNNFGTAFKITSQGVLTTLHRFKGTDGSDPETVMVRGTNGVFYATTDGGGATGHGTVFKMTPAGALTRLVSFNGTNGCSPQGDLTLGKDGNFYGTTQLGGLSHFGTVFKMTPAGSLTILFSFQGKNGSQPAAGLLLAKDGSFYGTVSAGAAEGKGGIFRLVQDQPPVFTGIWGAVGKVSLNWTSISGAIYRLQYKTNLTLTNWTAIVPDVTATGTQASFTDEAGKATERFYRIVLLPAD